MTEKTVSIKLKEPWTELDGSNVKKTDKVKILKNPDGTPKSIEQIREEADDFYIGEGIARLLMFNIKAKDQEELAKLNRYARKFQNLTMKGKGDWDAKQDEIKDLQELMARVSIETGTQHLVGDVLNLLDDAKERLKTK